MPKNDRTELDALLRKRDWGRDSEKVGGEMTEWAVGVERTRVALSWLWHVG